MKTLKNINHVFFLLLTALTISQADDFEVIKKMPYGPSQEVVAQNDMVCLGSGRVLQICLLQEDSLIVQSEMVLSDYINGMAIAGDYLYVANDEKGLQIIDISDSINPEIVGNYESNSSAKSVYVQGDTLYLQTAPIEVINIQEKSNPAFIEYININRLKSFSIDKNYIYANCGNRGLKIYDIADLSLPVELAVIDTLGNLTALFYEENWVYTVSSQKGISITDVSDPADPQVMNSLDTPGFPDDVFVFNNHAYISDFYSIRIIDVSNKSTPQEINFISEYPYTNSVFVALNYMYSTSENEGVRIYDVSSPDLAEKIYTHNLPDAVHNIIYNNGTLYRNDFFGDSVSVSKFSFPDTTGVNSIYVNGFHYLIRYPYLFVGDGELIIYDITDASNPVEVSRFDQTSVRYFTLMGDTAFCSTGNSNLLILDISDIDSIKEVGFLEVDDYIDLPVFYNSNLYVQNSSRGFIIYDASDFNNIVEKMRIDLEGMRYLQIEDSLLFVAADWNGMSVYNISDPDTLLLAGHYTGTVLSFCIDDNLIYTAGSISGLQVLDWTNLQDIKKIAMYDTYGESYDVFVSNDTVIVADGENGVIFLKETIEVGISGKKKSLNPQAYSLSQNYPNPFNPTTNIKYKVKTFHGMSQQVNLSIYNLLGQKVATLVNKKQSAGEYNVIWDASGFATGVYYYKLDIGPSTGSGRQFKQVKKMVLIK